MAVKQFQPLSKPATAKPQSQYEKQQARAAGLTLIRDQFTLSTWLAIGACIEGLVFFAIGKLALTLPIAVVIYRVLDAFLQATGNKKNEYMNEVVLNKFSGQIPNEIGEFGDKPANGSVAVFMLGFRCNHPLGLLAPGFKEVGDGFNQMMKDLHANAEEYGLLGASDWLSMGERSTSNEVLTLMYFRSMEDIHNFAHNNKAHTDTWKWFNSNVKKMPYISIWHEAYVAPSGSWEGIYINSHRTGFAASTFKGISEETGEEVWIDPNVDARKGLLKTSMGRMSRSQGHEHDKFGADPYENYGSKQVQQ